MKKLVFTIVLAAVLWAVMFSPLTAPYVNFWWMMTASALTLSILSTCFNRGWWHAVRFGWGEVLAGVGIAVVLWGIFWTGDKVSSWLFDFARPQVDLIYGMKEGESLWLLSLLMLVLEPRCGLCGHDVGLCAGACRFVQLHAGNGCRRGRRGVGRSVPSVSPAAGGHYRVACRLGCGGVRMVSHLKAETREYSPALYAFSLLERMLFSPAEKEFLS